MLLNESISVAGDVSICVTDKDGIVKDNREMHNLIVTYGKNHIAARLTANYILWVSGSAATLNTLYYYANNIYKCTTLGTFNTVAPTHTSGAVSNGTATLTWYSVNDSSLMSHIGFGTSTIAPIISDVALLAPLGARAPVSLSHTAGTNSVTATASYSGSAGSITEAGIFNSLTGNTMICRTTFGAISILSTDTLAISWTLKIN